MASACVYVECPITGRVLGVARRDNQNDFGLPGGKVEPGELELDAAVRELEEETGIKANRGHLREVFRRQGGVTFRLDWPDGCYQIGPAKAGEPRVDWVTLDQLMNGSFGDYNMRLLAALGRLHAGGC